MIPFGQAVPFPSDGPSSGIGRVGEPSDQVATTFLLPDLGVWQITWQIGIIAPADSSVWASTDDGKTFFDVPDTRSGARDGNLFGSALIETSRPGTRIQIRGYVPISLRGSKSLTIVRLM